jgi:cytochrome c553
MGELFKALLGTSAIAVFFAIMIYPNLAYSGYSSESMCIGECYEEYVKLNGTPSEIEQRKQAAASADEFSSIRSLWAGCAACHGADGQGMGPFPSLQGRDKGYIVQRLVQYKNKEQVGSMSSTMWAQAGMLSDQDMETIGAFIEAGLPK